VPSSGGKLGFGTIDKLTGNGGADVFILGDSRGMFYDDGTAKASGLKDYAVITDFGMDDKIQLKGASQEYLQSWRTLNGVSGTAIFHDTNKDGILDNRDEMIALVQDYGYLSQTNFLFF
jgi:Ca2+-binding RTX toxin-like protein